MPGPAHNLGPWRPSGKFLTLVLTAFAACACSHAPERVAGPPAPIAESVACVPSDLEGEWRAANGLAIRFSGPFAGPFDQGGSGEARVLVAGSQAAPPGSLLYSKIRRAADCQFLVSRHLWLDRRLHASPPHVVALKLDEAANTLSDDYSHDDIRLVFDRVRP